jgi:hypothetical protein
MWPDWDSTGRPKRRLRRIGRSGTEARAEHGGGMVPESSKAGAQILTYDFDLNI